ncbi:MAG: LPXTG cell wall anchor domain-containing protein [Clostridia bacterium]|nr:LPXTG cell wall anchor domain-containing protein [Clostridia bacterium]
MRLSKKLLSLILMLGMLFTLALPAFARTIKDDFHVEIIKSEFYYDGNPHALEFDVYASWDLSTPVDKGDYDISVYYSEDLGETWSTSAPEEVGEYKYRIEIQETDAFNAFESTGYLIIERRNYTENDGEEDDWKEPEPVYLDAYFYIDYNFCFGYDQEYNAFILKVKFFDMEGNEVNIGDALAGYDAGWSDFDADPRTAWVEYWIENSDDENYRVVSEHIVYVYDREAWEEEENSKPDTPVPNPDDLSIILMGAIESHTYEAYQLFAGDPMDVYNEDGDFVETVLSSITWGSAANDNVKAALIAWYKAQTGKTEDPSAADVAKLLSDANVSEVAKLFASVTLPEDALEATEFEDESSAYIFTYENPGFWLVRDAAGSTDDLYTSATAYILVTTRADDHTVIYLKQPTDPEVDKSGTTPAPDADSFNGGDEKDSLTYAYYGAPITYTLSAHFPGNDIEYGETPHNFPGFESYFFRFVDTLPAGLKLDEDSFVVYTNNSTEPISDDYYDVTILPQNDGTTLILVEFCDLKTLPYKWIDEYEYEDEDGNVTIESCPDPGFYSLFVDYTAIVTADAPSDGTEITNVVYGVYSNNPNGEGFGKTPDAEASFTLANVIINKVDEEGNPLAGAEFILGWWRPREGGSGRYPDLWVILNDDGTYTYTVDSDAATRFVSDEYGKIHLTGLRPWSYSAYETKAPTGYNKLDGEISILGWDEENYASTTTVINERGLVLPSTGGMGTTLLYVLGGLLVVGGGIWFFVKNRNKDDDDDDESSEETK